MRKLFTLLCTMLLIAQFAVAQKNLYVISKAGELTYYPTTKVFFDNDLFTFTYGEVTEITKESFAASVNVESKSSEVKSFNQEIEVGICFSDSNTTPAINDGKIKVGTALGYYTFSVSSLDAGTTYYYRAYVKINNVVYYGDVRNETTLGKAPSYINGHKFIDLGLPSGLLWAETNIGAKTAYDDGNYYAWGETAPKSTYSKATYTTLGKYDDGEGTLTFTKYISTDGKTTLENSDDAAYVNWGSGCRMSTHDEMSELCNTDNCTWTWVSRTNSDGETINCYKVVSVKNGNIIYLPASGGRYGANLYDYGSNGCYWSSTVYDVSYAYRLNFICGYHYMGNYDNIRYYGFPVRPVAEQ